MAKPDRNRNITRAVSYDEDGNQRSAGWMVRFNRRGKSYQSFFGDSKHGGEKKSLAAARADRDAKEPKYRMSTPAERLAAMKRRNTSGVIGVRWAERTIKKAKKTYTFLFATPAWTGVKGQRHTAAFSVLKYGKKEAWALACKARDKGVKERMRALKA
jgi:hypothetical protein